MYMVGTAVNTVAPYRVISSSASTASNLGSRMIDPPRRNVTLSTAICPKMWNSGSPPNTTSSGVIGKVSIRATLTCSIMLRWVPMAPLGVPVVPLV